MARLVTSLVVTALLWTIKLLIVPAKYVPSDLFPIYELVSPHDQLLVDVDFVNSVPFRYAFTSVKLLYTSVTV